MKTPALLAVLALACVGLLWAGCGQALALGKRGHTFAFSFGSLGDAAGQFKNPSSVAVNEATGELYVSDKGNNRVEQFAPEVFKGEITGYKFVSAWGLGVSDGKLQYEICTGSCQGGAASKSLFDEPGQIAVDNSTNLSDPSKGDVYVVGNHLDERGVVRKFSPDGERLSVLVGGELAEEMSVIEGVAVDANGLVWVDGEAETIKAFSDEGQLLEEVEPSLELSEAIGGLSAPLRPGLSVATVALGKEGHASQDHLYLNYEPGGEEVEGHGKLCKELPCATAEVVGFGIEADAQEGLAEVAAGQTVDAEVGRQTSTGAAVDPVTASAYVDNATSIAQLASSGGLIQRFGGAEPGFAGLAQGGQLAVDHAGGPEVGDVFAVDSASDGIDVFAPAPPGAPAVEALVAKTVASETAQVSAQIDPDGLGTSYRAVYSSPACTGSPSSCSGEAPIPSGSVEGFGAREVPITLEGLAPSTTYDVRVLAENADGKAERYAVFTTRTSAVESAMLDGRAWELVSPAHNHGASVEGIRDEGGLIQASEDGRAIAYITAGSDGENEPAGYRGPEPAQLIGKRSGASWFSEDIVTADRAPSEGFVPGGPWEYQFFASDLSGALAHPLSHVPLDPEQEVPVRDVYLREASGHFVALVTRHNDTAVNGNGEAAPLPSEEMTIETATPDLSQVVLSSLEPLTSEVSSGGALYVWSKATEALQLVSRRPDGTPVVGFVGGGNILSESKMLATAIAPAGTRLDSEGSEVDSGTRIVWKELGGEKKLYLRELAHTDAQGGEAPARTYDVAEPNAPLKLPPGAVAPTFETATTRGNEPYRVFFVDEVRLTASSSATSRHPDLYVFEPEKPEGERVTDLGPSLTQGEGAGVQGELLGAGEDGATVYFAADGVLASGAERGSCGPEGEVPPSATCNLYVVHYDAARGHEAWEAPHFIARLSEHDMGDWGEKAGTVALKTQTARTSPNGEYLAFMSQEPLTGYDNEDISSQKPGERLDEEVYLYHLGASGPVCASCDPSGARPNGILDQNNPLNPERQGLLVDQAENWFLGGEETARNQSEPDHWLAASVPGWTAIGNNGAVHQSRYLSNDGRLFFDSADPLVTLERPTKEELVEGRETNVGVENVYEYEPRGLGDCTTESVSGGCVSLISSGESAQESAFVDASTSGDDVFFITDAKLTPNDPDTAFNLFDARVCDAAGAEPCPVFSTGEASECSGEAGSECRTGGATGVEAPTPVSATPGSGNLAAPSTVVLSSTTKHTAALKPLTRAQKLKRALAACHKDRKPSKRVACERLARKRFGAAKKRRRG